uniref:DUF6824 domain-containing protein n=1 Tax=Entomoneis paludosa TaxID=265537 RepID=A0A7S3DS74_9STRA|mmetsp:Transcript_32314/g.67390  ORF Transcript_32314/g.67390 Transcript_32314/m.67390 type:complete len:180 (+) Transcript_32314:162-701(+)
MEVHTLTEERGPNTAVDQNFQQQSMVHVHHRPSTAMLHNNNASPASSDNNHHDQEEKKWVVDPLPTDIICGRGARVSHPGNQHFRTIVMQRKGEYQQAKRREDKTRITLDIVHVLMGGAVPARFLLKDPDTDMFYDVGIDYAKEKVSPVVSELSRRRRCCVRIRSMVDYSVPMVSTPII